MLILASVIIGGGRTHHHLPDIICSLLNYFHIFVHYSESQCLPVVLWPVFIMTHW